MFLIERSSPNSIHSVHLAKLHIAAGEKDEKPRGVHKWTLRLYKEQPAGNCSLYVLLFRVFEQECVQVEMI